MRNAAIAFRVRNGGLPLKSRRNCAILAPHLRTYRRTMNLQGAHRAMTPVLKWAGGKTQLLDAIRAGMPDRYRTYYEPFVGGGAVFLSVAPRRAVINDSNEQLMNAYRQLKAAPELVIEKIRALDAVPCDKAFYLDMRKRYNLKIARRELDPECAALMIWLNKRCFNGLYRVNRKGLFNVPYNNGGPIRSIDRENALSVGKFLQSADISLSCADFETACRDVSAGDFVYFDSPYVPVSETANFTSYTKDGFTWRDHERLAALFRRLDAIGAKLMLSNHDAPTVRRLYDGFSIRSVAVKRMINRDAKKRTGQEVLITNY